MKPWALFSAFLLAFTFTATLQAEQTADKPDWAKGLLISEARVREPMPGKDVTVAYFNLHNASDQDRALVGIETPITDRAEMHSHSSDDGMMRMRKESEVPVPAQGHQRFKPGGYHVMLFDIPEGSLKRGETVELRLLFDDGSELWVDADVVSIFDRKKHGPDSRHHDQDEHHQNH